jgi:Zn-dependent protease with chaperone function
MAMNTTLTKTITLCAFGGMAMVAWANEPDTPDPMAGSHRARLLLSVVTHARRAAPPPEPALYPGRAVQFVERTRFPTAEREQLLAFHRKFSAAWQTPLPTQIACPLAQRHAQRILDRLIAASSLRQAVETADFPVRVVVTCGIADFPDAEIKAGVMEVSAELMLAMSSEDEIAAMMGHELAHYTLAHEAKKLQTHGRLAPYAARLQALNHEIEADAEGLILLANAGYDPYAAVDVMKVMRGILRERGWQSDAAHPDIDERIDRLAQVISHAGLQQAPRRTAGIAAVHREIRGRPGALLRKREDAALSY